MLEESFSQKRELVKASKLAQEFEKHPDRIKKEDNIRARIFLINVSRRFHLFNNMRRITFLIT